MEQEIWKDIEGYEGLYQVSNLGRVRGLDRFVDLKSGKKRFVKGRVLKPYLTGGERMSILCGRFNKFKNSFCSQIGCGNIYPESKQA